MATLSIMAGIRVSNIMHVSQEGRNNPSAAGILYTWYKNVKKVENI